MNWHKLVETSGNWASRSAAISVMQADTRMFFHLLCLIKYIKKQKSMRGLLKRVLSCRHDAFFAFHQINAVESGDDLLLDVSAYPDNQILVQLHRTNMLFGLNPMAAAIPTRYVYCQAYAPCTCQAASRMLACIGGSCFLPTRM